MNANLLAVMAAAVFVFFIIKGYRKGFLRIAVTLVGTVAVMITTLVLSTVISRSLINSPGFYGRIENKLVETFTERLTDTYPEDDEGLPVEDKTVSIDELDIPDIIKTGFMEDMGRQMYQELILPVIIQYAAGYAAKLIIKSSVFVFISAALSILLWFVLKTTDLIARIPVIKGFNRTLGAAAGGIEALLLIWAAFLIIVMFLGNDLGSRLLMAVKESPFLSLLFNTNPLLKFCL
jgi:uncharacterized membrane protein required for colicin V production